MSAATSTEHQEGGWSALLWHPATFAPLTVVIVAYYAHWSLRAEEFGAAAAWLVAGAITFYWRHLTHASKLTRAMADVGLVHRDSDGRVGTPRLIGHRKRGRNYTARWALPPGVTLRDVQSRAEALEQHCNVGLRFWFAKGLLHGEVLRHEIPDAVPFTVFYKGVRASSGDLVVGIGQGQRGPIITDLATLPHLLVGGQTGGGKSVFLRQLLTGLLLSHHPDELNLACIDLKGGVELHRFASLPHAMAPVADSIDGAASLLAIVRTELDRRLRELRAAGLSDIQAWHAESNPRWPHILVVVDEVAELTARALTRDGRSERDAATGRLSEIARLGRAPGIHLVVCTQRPDADAVPGQLKANLPATVAFRVRNGINSRILLDTDRAALLPPVPGRGVWSHDAEEEFQGIYLDSPTSARLLDDRWRSYSGPTAMQMEEQRARSRYYAELHEQELRDVEQRLMSASNGGSDA